MTKLIEYLNLKDIGFLELLFALFPILLGYKYLGFSGDIFLLIFMDVIALMRRPKIFFPVCLKMLFVYILFHEFIVYAFFTNQPSYMRNAIISHIVTFISIPILASSINHRKLVGSYNIVALMCIIGLIYHFTIIIKGGYCAPLRIPFLNAPPASRFFQDSFRPLSFFWEPQSYCSFMLIPLFYSMINEKIIWTIIIVLSMFLSTSTTGIILAPTVILTYALTQQDSLRRKLFYALIMVSLVYALFSLSFFELGVDKLQTTDASENTRLTSGIEYIHHMNPNDLILGIPAANATDYYLAGGLDNHADIKIGVNSHSIYISTFWNILIKFGILGLIFYLLVFLFPAKKNKEIIIYIMPLFIALFTNPDYINSAFAIEIIFIYSYIYFIKKQNESTYSYYTVCE